MVLLKLTFVEGAGLVLAFYFALIISYLIFRLAILLQLDSKGVQMRDREVVATLELLRRFRLDPRSERAYENATLLIAQA